MTRDYAVTEGFIAPVDGCLAEERKFPYLRVTMWYGAEDYWMLQNAIRTFSGCAFLLIVDGARQAIARRTSETQLIEE